MIKLDHKTCSSFCWFVFLTDLQLFEMILFAPQCDCRHQLEKTAASYITTLLVLEHLFLPFCKNIKMHRRTLLVEYTFQLSFNHHLCSGGWIAWFGHWQRCHPVSLGRYFRLHLLCLPAIKEYSLDCI